jgi:hypothetical protein
MPRDPNAITPRGGGRGTARLSSRDVQVVELVGRFRLVAAEQIRSVLFPTQTSKTPLDRTCKRLTEMGYLARLGRMVGGFGGGSGQYVYQLGRAGWRLLGKGGGYRPLRAIDLHTLTIAECFAALKRLERQGVLTVIAYEADPASRRTVGNILLTPDAYVELGLQALKLKYRLWLEIDRDTENAETIKGKCVRYWRAFQAWDEDVFPYVVFVVPDAARQHELERVIAGGPDEAQALFQVYQLDNFGEVIHRNL